MKQYALVLGLIGCEASDVAGNTSDAFMPDTLPTCTGTCTTTALTATFMATRTLDVAYYGVNSDLTVRIEAYKGAAVGCPMMKLPVSEYTLVLANAGAQGTSSGSFIDSKGDLLGSATPVMATTVSLTPVAASEMFVAYDVMLTFAAGTVNGHLYATHCSALDQ